MAPAADFSELRAFATDLRTAPTRVVVGARAIVAKGAVNIKTQLRAEMGASTSFAPLARGIGYDIVDAAGLAAEVGPVKRNRGGKSKIGTGANIAYFGGSNGGGGTVADPVGALNAEAPRFEASLSALLGDVL